MKQSGQWSRPPAGFTRGVRPNSARLHTSVVSSRPRCARSSIRARVGLVVHRADDVAHALDRSERLRPVNVPGDLVEHGQEGVDRHEPHAALDQPPRQQAALAEAGHAVALAESSSVPAPGRRPRRAWGLVISRNADWKLPSSSAAFSDASNVATASSTSSRILRRRSRRTLPISLGGSRSGTRKSGCEGSALSDERVVRLAEKPAGLAVGQVAAAAAHQLGQHDERRQVGLAALQVADHRPDVRRVDAAGEQPAGLHHLPARVVHRRAAVMDRAHERELVGDLRRAAAGSPRTGSPATRSRSA